MFHLIKDHLWNNYSKQLKTLSSHKKLKHNPIIYKLLIIKELHHYIQDQADANTEILRHLQL